MAKTLKGTVKEVLGTAQSVGKCQIEIFSIPYEILQLNWKWVNHLQF